MRTVISNIVNKRIILSIITLVIGITIYFLFDMLDINKGNLFVTLIRNHLMDGLWSISFFFIAINFSKNITSKYLLLTSIVVVLFGFVFEMMQLFNIVNGTFDYIDILVYMIAILISCFIEKKYMEE